MPDLFLELSDNTRDGYSPPPLSEFDAVTLLMEAEITAAKLIPWGSNYSFAVALETKEGGEQLAVYKPRAGEAPLYDFPDGTLFLREVAAFRLSQFLGWGIVPPTVLREGPHGVGSLQLYVEPMAESESWNPRTFWGQQLIDIERIVLFDHITNNADRKLGHCLRDQLGKVWGIDHGLTFNEAPKLRTALWQFVGEPISVDLLGDLYLMLQRAPELRELMGRYLSDPEITALLRRTERFAEMGRYPNLNPRRNVPYGWW